MIYYLFNGIHCKNNNTIIILRPKLYDLNKNNAQSITFPNRTPIPVEYNGVLPCITVCRPTNPQVKNCEKNAFVSKIDWYPYYKGGIFLRLKITLTILSPFCNNLNVQILSQPSSHN